MDVISWLLENSDNGTMPVRIEKKDAPTKWITLKALLVQKEYPPDIAL